MLPCDSARGVIDGTLRFENAVNVCREATSVVRKSHRSAADDEQFAPDSVGVKAPAHIHEEPNDVLSRQCEITPGLDSRWLHGLHRCQGTALDQNATRGELSGRVGKRVGEEGVAPRVPELR